MQRLVSFLVLVQVIVAGAAAGQSLADVARREEQRRKTISKPAKTYTNKDLGPGGVPPATQPAAAGASAPAEGPAAPPQPDSPAASPEGQPAADPAAEPDDEEVRAKEEQEWRAKVGDARAQLERNRMFAEALQTRANSLWADFTARDDPAQRATIERDRQKTLAELDRVKAEIESQTKAIADLEEEARRAGVPPGWLR